MAGKKKSEPKEQIMTPAMASIDKACLHLEQQTALLKDDLAQLEKLVAKGTTAAELAFIYKRIRDVREALMDACAPLASEWTASGIYDKLQKKLVPEAFEREGISSFTSSWGFRVTTGQKYYASMRDKEKAMAWLQENGLGALIQPTVNASTLSAAGKAMLDEGKELDDELFECYFQPNTSLTRMKVKE